MKKQDDEGAGTCLTVFIADSMDPLTSTTIITSLASVVDGAVVVGAEEEAEEEEDAEVEEEDEEEDASDRSAIGSLVKSSALICKTVKTKLLNSIVEGVRGEGGKRREKSG